MIKELSDGLAGLRDEKRAEMMRSLGARIARGVDIKLAGRVFLCQCDDEAVNSLRETLDNFQIKGISITRFRGRDNVWINGVDRKIFESLLRILLHYRSALKVRKANYSDSIDAKAMPRQLEDMTFCWDVEIEGLTTPGGEGEAGA